MQQFSDQIKQQCGGARKQREELLLLWTRGRPGTRLASEVQLPNQGSSWESEEGQAH